ncbi:MAG: hypothetical protein WAN48_13740, partial [Actinomycetes bacterium]
AARSPVAAGVLAALAVCTKVSYVLYVMALTYALRRSAKSWLVFVTAGAVTGLALVTPFLPELLSPLRDASTVVARQSPWRIVLTALRQVLPDSFAGNLVSLGVWVLVALIVWRLGKVLPRRTVVPAEVAPGTFAAASPVTADALWAAALLGTAWLLSATYAYAWYDVIAWAPLILLVPSGVDLVVLTRMATVALAYVPGMVLDPPGALGSITTTINGTIAPLVGLGLVLVVLVRPRWLTAGALGQGSGSGSLRRPDG